MDAVSLKLSVCCLPLEIKVCSNSEKNEKDNSVGQDSANMATRKDEQFLYILP